MTNPFYFETPFIAFLLFLLQLIFSSPCVCACVRVARVLACAVMCAASFILHTTELPTRIVRGDYIFSTVCMCMRATFQTEATHSHTNTSTSACTQQTHMHKHANMHTQSKPHARKQMHAFLPNIHMSRHSKHTLELKTTKLNRGKTAFWVSS